MTAIERWTIEELITRYELEPGLKDVFVEGVFDQEVLSYCFRCAEQRNRAVYEIDTVDIPSELLVAHGLSEGNKQRVIALARELSRMPVIGSYWCLVDRDLDHWFGVLERTPRLIWSDFCSIELYLFTEEVLYDVLVTTAKTKILNWAEYLQSFLSVLKSLYAMRAADRELGWKLQWLGPERCLSRDNSSVVLERSGYIDRLLMKNRRMSERSRFCDVVSEWCERFSGDCRLYIRGHDFVDLIAWSVSAFGGIKSFSSSEAIQRLFVLLAPRDPAMLKSLQ